MNKDTEPKIIVIMRLYNEERWIEQTLNSIYDICKGIVIFDNGSTDNTRKICEKCDKVLEIHKQDSTLYQNSKNNININNILLKMAMKYDPEYILSVDGDEILSSNVKDILFEELCILHPNSSVFEFQYLTIWDTPTQYRYDGVYSNTWYAALFKVKDQPKDLVYTDYLHYTGVSHIQKIPITTMGFTKPVRSKLKFQHLGYYDEKIRQKKYSEYSTNDDHSEIWDNYVHCIGGDGKFSGPNGMEFRTLPENMILSNIH